MDTFASKNYLAHYGVKGMKWGVRKTVEARKAVKKSIDDGKRDNYNKTAKKYRALLRDHYKKYSDPKQNLKKLYDEEDAILTRGKKELKKAMLRDAGYSERDANIGATWMIENGFSIRWDDDSPLDFVYDGKYEK